MPIATKSCWPLAAWGSISTFAQKLKQLSPDVLWNPTVTGVPFTSWRPGVADSRVILLPRLDTPVRVKVAVPLLKLGTVWQNLTVLPALPCACWLGIMVGLGVSSTVVGSVIISCC